MSDTSQDMGDPRSGERRGNIRKRPRDSDGEEGQARRRRRLNTLAPLVSVMLSDIDKLKHTQ